MAPIRSKRLKSPSSDKPMSHRSPYPQRVAIKSPARTPTQSPKQKTAMITQGQKQALIDNLQLEVTERARKLRAQYALQAQSLRTRIELRVNRIPTSLRKANMGELLLKYQERKKQVQQAVPAVVETGKPTNDEVQADKAAPISRDPRPTALKSRGTKRTSATMEDANKENAPDPVQPIPNPKKRAKASATASSRQPPSQSTVLSPKSSNSRTFPQSPIRPALGSPQKSYVSCPPSPLKPALPPSPAKCAAIAATASLANMVNEKPKLTRSKATNGRKATNPNATKPAVIRTRRGAANTQAPAVAEVRCASSGSNTSNTSTGTTVVKKGASAPKTASVSATTRKKNNNAVVAAGKKVTAGTDGPAAGRRVLRNRP